MPCQTPRLATFGGHYVNVKVAGVLAAECNPLSVRREMRICCLPLETCDTARAAPSARNSPNIVGVSESNLGGANRRGAQETRLPVRCLRLDRTRAEYQTADEQSDEQKWQATVDSRTTRVRREISLGHGSPPDGADRLRASFSMNHRMEQSSIFTGESQCLPCQNRPAVAGG